MLRHTFLLFFLCASTVAPQTTLFWPNVPSFVPTTYKMTTEERISSLNLVATPDYPVAEGQTVHLHCSTTSEPASVNWTWYHGEYLSRQVVGSEKDLTLSKPSETGQYFCSARTETQLKESQKHTVYIISMRPTAGESLGIAAFALVLLVLIINLAVFSWMGWRRMGDHLSTSITATKGSSEPGKSPKGGAQQADTEGDVYMNYTSTNQAYSDLDPVTMTDDRVYSSLS